MLDRNNDLMREVAKARQADWQKNVEAERLLRDDPANKPGRVGDVMALALVGAALAALKNAVRGL